MKTINFFLITYAVFFEYLRDYCFININILIKYLKSLDDGFKAINYTDSFLLNILENFDLETLIVIKWILTIFFAAVYFILGILFSYWNFDLEIHKKFLNYFLISGLALLLLSLIVYSTGKFMSTENQFNFYYVSIELSHFVQSSLYPISFILIFWSYNLRTSSN